MHYIQLLSVKLIFQPEFLTIPNVLFLIILIYFFRFFFVLTNLEFIFIANFETKNSEKKRNEN